jgi:hypothetical protein
MNDIVWSGFIETSLVYFTVPEFISIVQTEETYWWSIRYHDVDGLPGNYSDPTSFTTAEAFEDSSVAQPRILFPLEGARISPLSQLVATSAFEVYGGTDTHESTDWEMANSPSFASEHILNASLDDTANKESIVFDTDLTGNHGVYFRARHKGALTPIKSSWSPIRHAILLEFYDDPLIGVAFRRSVDTDAFAIRNIDINGNTVNMRGDYFAKHPSYIYTPTVIQSQHMRAVQQLYVKCDRDVDGDWLRMWISPGEFDGAYLHPAFMRSLGGPLYVSEYLCNITGGATSGGGSASSDPALPVTLASRGGIANPALTQADWLNDLSGDPAHTGWHVQSIWEYHLLTLLMLIEYRTLALTPILNAELPNPLPATASDPSMISYRGIRNPFITGSVARASQGGVIVQGFGNGYLGLPDNITNRVTRSWSYGAVGGATAVDSIKRGWDSAFGCDIELAFLPGVEGLGLNVTVGRNTGTGYGAVNDTMSVRYCNGPIGSFPINASTGNAATRAVLRICKGTQ